MQFHKTLNIRSLKCINSDDIKRRKKVITVDRIFSDENSIELETLLI